MEEFSDQIAERLLAARQKAGLTVDDVMFKTRLPRSVIVGLEAGDFTVFSSTTYAKSFLRQYSDYLKVDASVWLDALEPAAFVAGGEIMKPQWQATGTERMSQPQPSRHSGTGWTSTVAFLLVSCGLVFAAMKIYEHLDAKYAAETPVKPVPEAKPKNDSVGTPSKKIQPPKAVVLPESERENDSPPPRAILVR